MRDEVEIVLDGIAHMLRPSFDGLSRIEQELSTGLPNLANKLADGAITLQELLTILKHCLTQEIEEAILKEALLKGGLAHVVGNIGAMFAHLFASPETRISRGELNEMAVRFSDA